MNGNNAELGWNQGDLQQNSGLSALQAQKQWSGNGGNQSWNPNIGEFNRATFSAIKTLYNDEIGNFGDWTLLFEVLERKSRIITNIWCSSDVQGPVLVELRHHVSLETIPVSGFCKFIVDATDKDCLDFHREGAKVLEAGSRVFVRCTGGGPTALSLDGVEISQT